MRSLGLTALLTVVSTTFSMIMTVLCAYPLSQKKFVGRRLFNTIVILTMYFNAGIIPDYLNIKRLGMLDSFWALVLPVGISVFNMIIIKSFFQGLPDSLQESAEIDGATHWTILFRIYIPLSLPALATIALFYAVGRWNGFQDARFYISSSDKYPIQFKLYQIISNLSSVESSMEGVAGPKIAPESMKAASIMFATLPILMIYPWLQRYFVTGITLGAVKG
jgi:putative aldouronate transport system permease protein